eukprot:308143-Chlamydomonas_euryale.AAC.1
MPAALVRGRGRRVRGRGRREGGEGGGGAKAGARARARGREPVHTLCPAPCPYDRMTVPYRTAYRMYGKIGIYGQIVQPCPYRPLLGEYRL